MRQAGIDGVTLLLTLQRQMLKVFPYLFICESLKVIQIHLSLCRKAGFSMSHVATVLGTSLVRFGIFGSVIVMFVGTTIFAVHLVMVSAGDQVPKTSSEGCRSV